MPSYVAVSVTVGVVLTVALLLLTPRVPELPELRVAFIGNSIMFTYDLPRLVQTLSANSLIQNSCLHGSLNLKTQLQEGNGMYLRFDDDKNSSLLPNGLVDYGACSAPQLLFGYDELLEEENDNAGEYYNDGYNPCVEDETYKDYLDEYYQEHGPPQWDMVVFNDRTVYPALYSKRQLSLQVLQDSYVDMLRQSGARPVLLMTYAYNHSYTQWQDELGDIPEFTSHVYYGYQQYKQVLADALPESQQPIIAPAGLAYLVLWEEDRGMWNRLFYVDQLHPTPHGSFLLGCVLFATIYGRMPDARVALPNNSNININKKNGNTSMDELWETARKMQVVRSGPTAAFPTWDEAAFLYRIAERVTLEKYVPKSLLSMEEIMQLEEATQQQKAENAQNDDDVVESDDAWNRILY